jgi:hypothetical protein
MAGGDDHAHPADTENLLDLVLPRDDVPLTDPRTRHLGRFAYYDSWDARPRK